MKNKLLLLIGLALVVFLGIIIGNSYKKEVVDLRNFTEYYEENSDETGGWEVQKENFYIFSKDYSISDKDSEIDEKSNEKPEKREYVIVEGDNLSKIAEKYGLTVDILMYANPKVYSKNLKIGQKITIYNRNGIFYTVVKGDNLKKIADLFKVNIEDIKKENNLESDILKVGMELFIPKPNLRRYLSRNNFNSRKESIKNIRPSDYGFIMPIKYSGISSPFGNRFHPVLKRYIYHSGADLRARFIPVYAAKEGKVSFAGVMRGYGKIIIIQHVNGYETRYAHLDKIGVKKGDTVKQGELIGKTGQSGRVTGPHLHLELRINGKAVNPMRYISVK